MAEAEITLDKVDCLRDRANLSYEEAVDYLRRANGDIVQALVLVERDLSEGRRKLVAKGNEIVAKLKELVRTGNEMKIRVSQRDKTLVEVPVTAGIVGAMLAPQVAVLGALTALATRCAISIDSPKDLKAAAQAQEGTVAQPDGGSSFQA
ncbi:MAG TPA: DUF4342 domain-containing protein [Firmicutes bacterium]|nr:DUF4342 domain-containing protein [Bacillota bacterium]